MARDRVAERLVGLALVNGVDFRRADPSDRDWNLYLSLAVGYLNRKEELEAARQVRLANARGRVELTIAGVARSTSKLDAAQSAWQKEHTQYLYAVADLSEEEVKEIENRSPSSGIMEAYKEVGGDMTDPFFAEQAEIAYQWVLAGNRGERR